MPLLLEKSLVLFDQATEFRQFVIPEIDRACKSHRSEPELRVSLRLVNMDMRGLFALPAEKEEPISLHPQNSWHCPFIPQGGL
jgi:hypothetical protein